MAVLRISEVRVAPSRIDCAAILGEREFHASVAYEDADLTALDPELADRLAFQLPPLEVPRELVSVGATHGMPAHVAAAILPQLEQAARLSSRRLSGASDRSP